MAKKMVLVDPRTMQFPSSLLPPVGDPVPDALRRLDSDMEAILKTPSLQLAEKVDRYNQVLTDYLTMTKDYRVMQQRPPGRVNQGVGGVADAITAGADDGSAAASGGVGSDEKQSDVLGMVTQKYRPKAQRLLTFLSRVPQVSWTQRGELKVGDHVYEDSHIVDLVSNAVKPQTATSAKSHSPPSAWTAFAKVLKEANVPQDMISATVKREWEKRSFAHALAPTTSRSGPSLLFGTDDGEEGAKSPYMLSYSGPHKKRSRVTESPSPLARSPSSRVQWSSLPPSGTRVQKRKQ